MKKIWFGLFSMVITVQLHAQNVGIGTTTPTEILELKRASRSTLKISSENFTDTSQLVLSNKNASNTGTEFRISAIRESGLFITSFSDLPANNSDSLLVIETNGNIGIGVKNPSHKLEVRGNSLLIGNTGIDINPTAKLHVNGGIKIEGTNIFEFGSGIAGKEVNAGKVGYNAFGQNALTFVGAGTNAINRAVYFFAEGGTTFGGPVSVYGNTLVNNDLTLNGKLTTPTTGNSNMVPVCMGTVRWNNGTLTTNPIINGTGNFTLSPTTVNGMVEISINGHYYSTTDYVTVATCVRDEGFGAATGYATAQDSGNGKLQIYTYIQGQNLYSRSFHFIVYRINN